MLTVTKGLSVSRMQDVEKFNSHVALVEMMILLKELMSNPKTISDLGKAKIEALKLTEAEEKKRNEALEIIAKSDDIKVYAKQLDERAESIQKQHDQNLSYVDKLKAELEEKYAERHKRLNERLSD